MKLFQRMLVASAAVGMIAPTVAQAADINIEDMGSYSTTEVSSNNDFQTIQPGDWTYQSIQEVAESRGCNVNLPTSGISRFDAATIINSCLGEAAEVTTQERTLIDEFATEIASIRARVDGLEARFNDFEAGSFSTTTTLDGKAVFVIGAVDGAEKIGVSGGEAVSTGYVYQMNLNTSFTGDDNLYVRLKTGVWSSQFEVKTATYHIEAKDNTDALKVDKIWYTFPIGDNVTAFIGPRIENYYMNAATVSLYRPGVLKAFKFTANGAVFGASTDTGAGFKYEADNGFAFGLNFVCKGGDATSGCLTKEDTNQTQAMLAYTGDNWHLSATYAAMSGGWNAFSYFATTDVVESSGQAAGGSTTTDSTAWALRGWWRPSETGSAIPTISVAYDTIDFGTGHDLNVDDGSGYAVGLMWYDMFQPDDRIGVAFGQPVKADSLTTGTLAEMDPFLWEAYYSFKLNDSVEMTPGIFGGTDVLTDTEDDIFGAVLTTTFKF